MTCSEFGNLTCALYSSSVKKRFGFTAIIMEYYHSDCFEASQLYLQNSKIVILGSPVDFGNRHYSISLSELSVHSWRSWHYSADSDSDPRRPQLAWRSDRSCFVPNFLRNIWSLHLLFHEVWRMTANGRSVMNSWSAYWPWNLSAEESFSAGQQQLSIFYLAISNFLNCSSSHLCQNLNWFHSSYWRQNSVFEHWIYC